MKFGFVHWMVKAVPFFIHWYHLKSLMVQKQEMMKPMASVDT